MHRHPRLLALALVVVLVGCSSVGMSEEDRTRLDDLNQNLSSMRQEICSLRTEISKLSSVKEDIQLLAICFARSQPDITRLADALEELVDAIGEYRGD